MILPIAEILEQIMDSFQCTDCCKNSSPKSISHTRESSFFPTLCYTDNVPIYGPDQISIKDCFDFVNNTIGLAKVLISKATPSVRGILTYIIDKLGEQARNCCAAGGIWKGCVQELCNKYHEWNQKWQIFGIPPDPTWD